MQADHLPTPGWRPELDHAAVWRRRRVAILLLSTSLAIVSCQAAEAPPHRVVLHLHGDAYQRGLAHGRALSGRVHSLYTTLLTSSLLPYLNREQPAISGLLPRYGKAPYDKGNFSYQLLLDSALAIEADLPDRFREELRGLADGSGLPYDEVLILNTFVDTVMAVRGIALAIRRSNAPQLTEAQVLGLEGDGRDNDGDGKTDEPGEGTLTDIEPLSHALFVEIPTSPVFRFVLSDPNGVNPQSVRVQLDSAVYEPGDPAVKATAVDGETLEVVFSPTVALPAAATVALVLQAADDLIVADPPPAHASNLRDVQLAFTTVGAGQRPFEVPNRGLDDGRSQPPSLAFALRGSATTDGRTLLAQHFALLDANTAHDHTALFVHHPDDGPPFAVVGWSGVVWGLSGLSDAGLGATCNHSDTLDNAIVKSLLPKIGDLANAQIVGRGLPIGFAIRQILDGRSTVLQGAAGLRGVPHLFGWVCLLADAQGGVRAVEVETDLSGDLDGGAVDYGPEIADPGNRDSHGRRLASVGEDDLRVGVHFNRDVDDLFRIEVQGIRIGPQRDWSSYWYRSQRVFALLGEAIAAGYGGFDREAVFELLRRPHFIDHSDSMNAVVIDPAARVIYHAMGTVPATDAPFEAVSLWEVP